MSRSRATILLAAAGLLAAAHGSAVQFTSSFSPIRIGARPGQVVTRTFQMRLTQKSEGARFKARAEDWWASEDGKQSFYQPAGTLPRSCAPWVSLNPAETSVEPGGTLEIRVTTAVPADATGGGYWCVLTIDQVLDPLAAPTGVGIQFLASISVGIFVDLPPVERAARIEGVEVGEERAMVRLRNAGNTPLAVEGRFEFYPPGGGAAAVATVPLPRTTLLLDPAPTRQIAAQLPDASILPGGRYLVRVVLDIGLDRYLGAQKEMEVRRGAGNLARR
jgi:hypothetical protein